MLLASTIVSTKINSSPQGKILQSMSQASLPHKPSQTFASFAVSIPFQIYFVFVSTVELRTLYIQELPYMNTFCECILKKIGLTHAHFQYNSRKLVNVVKSPFYYDVFFEKIK